MRSVRRKLRLVLVSICSVVMVILYLHRTPTIAEEESHLDLPKLVMIVSYQRSGSSFFGEIFNQDSEAFTWYEPFDGLYSAIYGTQYGYNVPADIWNHRNGTERNLPAYEIELLARTARDILTCDFADLPTEILMHRFLSLFQPEHQRLSPYVQCIAESGKRTPGKSYKECLQCNQDLVAACPRRFGEDPERQMKCAKESQKELFGPERNNMVSSTSSLLQGLKAVTVTALHKASTHKGSSHYLDKQILNTTLGDRTKGKAPPYSTSKSKIQNKSVSVEEVFRTYQRCMKPCRVRAVSCLDHLESVCHNATVRSIKPVRFPMEAAQRLKESLPSLTIIQNLRDPRAVVISRLHTSPSFQSLHAQKDVVKEARLFCNNAAAHARIMDEIEAAHAHSTMRVLYEETSRQPAQTAMNVYGFLGLPATSRFVSWLAEIIKTRHLKLTADGYKKTILKWEAELTVATLKDINSACLGLFKAIRHPWPLIY